MQNEAATVVRAQLATSLREAERAGRGVTAEIETHARAFARARREEGVTVERVIIEVKAMVNEIVMRHPGVFIPRVVGWTVAGYFAGTARRDEA